MAKRPADEPLENITYQGSPSIKKVRLESVPERDAGSNGISHPNDELNLLSIQQAKTDVTKPDQPKEELQDSGQDSDFDEEHAGEAPLKRENAPADGYNDLYLDTIDRFLLDFDFEKLCSVTLSNINVYACLVCGKYFQGRGPKSHAYFHALDVGHHVYINMESKRVYVLPEGYEVMSKSLDDIKFVVDPRLSKDEVLRLDKDAKDAWDLTGKKYHPGEQDLRCYTAFC